MKKLLFATAAVTAMGIAAPQAGAQSGDNALAHDYIYMQRDDQGAYRMFGPDFPEGQEVLYDRSGRPGDCPAGAWFIEENTTTGEFDQVRGCDTVDIGYDVGPMPSDMTGPNGEPLGTTSTHDTGNYEDTFLLTPRAD